MVSFDFTHSNWDCNAFKSFFKRSALKRAEGLSCQHSCMSSTSVARAVSLSRLINIFEGAYWLGISGRFGGVAVTTSAMSSIVGSDGTQL